MRVGANDSGRSWTREIPVRLPSSLLGGSGQALRSLETVLAFRDDAPKRDEAQGR
jgi:hypothetical protein